MRWLALSCLVLLACSERDDPLPRGRGDSGLLEQDARVELDADVRDTDAIDSGDAGDRCVAEGMLRCRRASSNIDDGFIVDECLSGAWTPLTGCGRSSCSYERGYVQCGESRYAFEGRPCIGEDSACAATGGVDLLWCVHGRWVVAKDCTGRNGCVSHTSSSACFNDVFREGDGCREVGERLECEVLFDGSREILCTERGFVEFGPTCTSSTCSDCP